MRAINYVGIGLCAGVLAVSACDDNDQMMWQPEGGAGEAGAAGSQVGGGAGNAGVAGEGGTGAVAGQGGAGGEGAAGQAGAGGEGAAGEAGAAGAAGEAGAAGAADTGQTVFAPRGGGLRVATYNVALAPIYEPLVDQRRVPLMNQLAREAQTLDALCVQELWLQDDWETFSSAVKDELPNVYRRQPETGPEDCAPAQLDEVFGCLAMNCPGAEGGALAECAMFKCGSVIEEIEPSCLNCLMGGLALEPEDLYFKCYGTGGPDGALFDGVFDVGLVTRKPLVGYESYRFSNSDSFALRNTVLHGAIEVGRDAYVHVYCAHLSSPLGVIDYQGPYADWDEEHAAQVLRLRELIQKTAGDDPVVVLGDLNMGPTVGANVGLLEDQFELLLGDDLSAPFALADEPICSECPDNTMRDPNSDPRLVDHILTRGVRAFGLRRFLTRQFRVEVDGTYVRTNLSDHYGLRAHLR